MESSCRWSHLTLLESAPWAVQADAGITGAVVALAAFFVVKMFPSASETMSHSQPLCKMEFLALSLFCVEMLQEFCVGLQILKCMSCSPGGGKMEERRAVLECCHQ